MDWQSIIPEIFSFVAGGGLVGVFTINAKRKKANVEVKVDEIAAMHQAVEQVYKPIIEQQNARINELNEEVKSLRQQLSNERSEHQREIDALRKQILDISKAIGVKVTQQAKTKAGAKKEKKNEA